MSILWQQKTDVLDSLRCVLDCCPVVVLRQQSSLFTDPSLPRWQMWQTNLSPQWEVGVAKWGAFERATRAPLAALCRTKIQVVWRGLASLTIPWPWSAGYVYKSHDFDTNHTFTIQTAQFWYGSFLIFDVFHAILTNFWTYQNIISTNDVSHVGWYHAVIHHMVVLPVHCISHKYRVVSFGRGCCVSVYSV